MRTLTFQYIAHIRGIGEDLEEVLWRGFAGLHPRTHRNEPREGSTRSAETGDRWEWEGGSWALWMCVLCVCEECC